MLKRSVLFGAAIFNQMWFIINDTGFALAADNAQFLFFVVNGTFIVFLIAAAIALGGALGVVTTRNIVYAAFSLLASLIGVACLFLTAFAEIVEDGYGTAP